MSEQAPDTGIKVIIVGAGFAGLTAAIECHLKGHSVTLLESFEELKILGDIISFGPNAGRIMARWADGTFYERLFPISHQSKGTTFLKYDGDFIIFQPRYPHIPEAPVINGHRGEIHEIFFNYAQELGIDIRLGCKVLEYVETPEKSGVVVNGETIWGDVVIGSDGVRSKARELVLGFFDKPKSSGYAIYRAWMDSGPILADPLTRHLSEHGDTHTGWLGPDVHFLAASVKEGKDFSWVVTHRDEADIEESWSFPGKIEEALKVVEGWDPVCRRIVELTPPEGCVDWKLVYRDPLPTWVSKEGRTCLAGDSAHPFLPTSVQGASQAMEDGVVLAVCLQLAGKANVPTAVRAYEKIRYTRCRRAQLLGEETRDTWHKADFNKIKENPEVIKMKREDWLFLFDCEKDARERYAEVAEELAREAAGKSA